MGLLWATADEVVSGFIDSVSNGNFTSTTAKNAKPLVTKWDKAWVAKKITPYQAPIKEVAPLISWGGATMFSETEKDFATYWVDEDFTTKKAENLGFDTIGYLTSTLKEVKYPNDISLAKIKANDISLAKIKAKDISNDLTNKNSDVSKAFIKNLGEDKWDVLQSSIALKNKYKEEFVNSPDTRKAISWAMGVTNNPIVSSLADKFIPRSLEIRTAFEEATDESGEGYGIGYHLNSFLVGAWVYWGIWIWAEAAAVRWMFGKTISSIAKESPYLYTATFDSAFTTAVDYWVTKSMGGDYSLSDVGNSLILGAVIPWAIKGIGKLSGKVTRKDIKEISSIVEKETSLWKQENEVLDEIQDYKLDSWVTLKEILENSSKWVHKIDSNIVRSSLAKEGIAVSNKAAKRIADAFNELNSKIKWEDETLWGYWELWNDGKIITWKQAILNKLYENKVVTEKEVDEAISLSGLSVEKRLLDDIDDDVEEVIMKTDMKDLSSIDSIEKSITWEKVITHDEIDELRFKNTSWILSKKDVEKLSLDYDVKIDSKKAFGEDYLLRENPKVNNEYITTILDEIEAKKSGYSKARDRILKDFNTWFKAKITSAKKVLWDVFGKETTLWDISSIVSSALSKTKVGAKFALTEWKKAIKELSISKETSSLVKRIDEINKIIAKEKNIQLKNKFAKEKELLSNKLSEAKWKLTKVVEFGKYLRDSIDMQSEKYPILSSSEKARIKNKYKALIRPNTTINNSIKIIDRFNFEMWTSSVKEIERKTSSIMKKIKNSQKKTKVSNIDVEYLQKIIEAYTRFTKAKEEGNLFEMKGVYEDLVSYYKLGKDVAKIAKEIKNNEINNAVASMSETLASRWEDRIVVRWMNTPTMGKKSFLSHINDFANSVISSNLNIAEMFKWNKKMVDIFLTRFQKANNIYLKMKRDIVDIAWVNALKKATKIFANQDDASYGLSLWMGSKDELFHKNNLMSNFIVKKNSKWEWEQVFVSDVKNFIKKNQAKFDNNEFVYFWNQGNDELKETILSQIYGKLDNLYSTDKEFANAINAIKSHFNSTWDRMSEIGKRVFNKLDFQKVDNYFPLIKKGKWDVESAFDNDGDYALFVKDVINDGSTKSRVPPAIWETIDRELWFIESLNFHMSSSVHWSLNVENLIDAERTLTKLKKGRNWLLDDEIEKVEFGDLLSFTKDKDLKLNTLDSDMISSEAAQFLRTYIWMVATQWRNLKRWSYSRNIVQFFTGAANRLLLSSPWTAMKQVAALPFIAVQTSPKYLAGAVASANRRNFQIALEASWVLMERQATVISKEGRGSRNVVSSLKNPIQKGYEKWGELSDDLIGNTVKVVDGAMSWLAWISWISEYVAKNFPTLHKEGSAIDLDKIRISLWDDWGTAVTFANEKMNRIMGSNAITEKPIGSEDILVKGALIFQRTWLNQLISSYDSIVNAWREAKVNGTSVSLARIRQGWLYLSAALFTSAYFQTLDEMKNRMNVAIGAKSEEDVRKKYYSEDWEEKTPGFMDIFQEQLAYTIKVNMVAPNNWVDLTVGLTPFINAYKNVEKAESTSRKIEEGMWAGSKLLMNSFYSDWARYWVSVVWGNTLTEGKEIDKAHRSLKETYWELPKENLWELTKRQMEVNKAQSSISKENKLKKTNRDTFIEDAAKVLWKDFTTEDFMKYARENKELYNSLQLKTQAQAKGLIESIKYKNIATSWERDSVLMGKSAEVIFEVAIVPYLDKWDKQSAANEIKRLYEKGIIKSKSWYNEVAKLFNSY